MATRPMDIRAPGSVANVVPASPSNSFSFHPDDTLNDEDSDSDDAMSDTVHSLTTSMDMALAESLPDPAPLVDSLKAPSTFRLHPESQITLPKRLVGVSMKMYFDLFETQQYIHAIGHINGLPLYRTCGVFVVPSHPVLYSAIETIKSRSNQHIMLAAQDCHTEDKGPYTGDVSATMLKQVGCSMVVLGHAERRAPPHNEDDDLIGQKAAAAVRNGLIPILCIGEKEKRSIMSEGVGQAYEYCVKQVHAVLNVIPRTATVVLAYEPVWAIGAAEPASADHVLGVVKCLRDHIENMYRVGEVRILYGGSAGEGTWQTLKGGLDGLFLGRFAHNFRIFESIVEEIENDSDAQNLPDGPGGFSRNP
ncbi:hypothetical protein MMC12_006904 [Toensbergia leucococca]|nr:hypothetical protein [Toensbergia leucococca]